MTNNLANLLLNILLQFYLLTPYSNVTAGRGEEERIITLYDPIRCKAKGNCVGADTRKIQNTLQLISGCWSYSNTKSIF